MICQVLPRLKNTVSKLRKEVSILASTLPEMYDSINQILRVGFCYNSVHTAYLENRQLKWKWQSSFVSFHCLVFKHNDRNQSHQLDHPVS